MILFSYRVSQENFCTGQDTVLALFGFSGSGEHKVSALTLGNDRHVGLNASGNILKLTSRSANIVSKYECLDEMLGGTPRNIYHPGEWPQLLSDALPISIASSLVDDMFDSHRHIVAFVVMSNIHYYR